MNTPRAYTEEEARDIFLERVRHLSEYWAEVPDKTPRERCDGLVFSILNVFDGTSGWHPALNISLSPHPDDMHFHQTEGSNWYEPGMVINDCMLHELFSR